MVGFINWCDAQNGAVGAHTLQTLTARAADLNAGRDAIAAVIPGHYAAEERIARNLKRLGKDAAAKYITDKLPTTKAIFTTARYRQLTGRKSSDSCVTEFSRSRFRRQPWHKA